MTLLPMFYYLGTMATLFVCILIAAHLYRSRLILYLLVPVLITRTFPRISFYYWGGMRYVLGLLAVLMIILFLKNKRTVWIFTAGIISALAFLTTIEAGVCAIVSIIFGLGIAWRLQTFDRGFILRSIKYYWGGLALIVIPYLMYLIGTGSLFALIDTTYTVVFLKDKVLLAAPGYSPEGLDFLWAMWPGNNFFKFMTPMYCFLFLIPFLVFLKRRNCFMEREIAIVVLGVYAMILYLAAFRKIQGHHFEMALQPEKIILFFMIEYFYFFLIEWTSKVPREPMVKMKRLGRIALFSFLIFALMGSSWGYAIARIQHRFIAPKWLWDVIQRNGNQDLGFLTGMETQTLSIDRAKGMVVPVWQAQEIEEVVAFVKTHTKRDEILFTYPELGSFNFWTDRPFVGRFPVASFSWWRDDWHQELVEDFLEADPHYMIMTNLNHRTFPDEWYFRCPKNKIKFEEMTNLILNRYEPIRTYESISIYQRKQKP